MKWYAPHLLQGGSRRSVSGARHCFAPYTELVLTFIPLYQNVPPIVERILNTIQVQIELLTRLHLDANSTITDWIAEHILRDV